MRRQGASERARAGRAALFAFTRVRRDARAGILECPLRLTFFARSGARRGEELARVPVRGGLLVAHGAAKRVVEIRTRDRLGARPFLDAGRRRLRELLEPRLRPVER